MRLNRWLLPALAIVVFFGVVGIAQATGLWVTSGRTISAAGVEKTAPAAGSLTAADLKGWMTLQQAADGLGMPVTDLIARIAPPADVTLAPDTAFKDVEKLVPGFSLTELRARLGQ